MRASINAMVLFLLFASGCFAGRSGSNGESDRDSDGGFLSTLDSGNTGGSYASFDASRESICGNNVREKGEICDGSDLGGATCGSLSSGQMGTLSCSPDCLNYNTMMCYSALVPPSCGNNVREEGEICDGFDLAGATCGSLAAGQLGTLSCAADCLNYVVDLCYTPGLSVCGNNVKEEGEICDGSDLGGATCGSLSSGQMGTLSCSPGCLNYDTTMCYYPRYDDAGVDEDDRIPASGRCVRNAGAQCEFDRDCAQGGCGGELCYNPDYGEIATTCDCTAPTGLSCGCVDGVCTWWGPDR